jgi:hypothetical protein
MRARIRALLLSTAMLFAATSYASAAFDGDCFPELAAAPKAVMVADTMPAEAAPEMSLRGTVGPVTDASDAPAEMLHSSRRPTLWCRCPMILAPRSLGRWPLGPLLWLKLV